MKAIAKGYTTERECSIQETISRNTGNLSKKNISTSYLFE